MVEGILNRRVEGFLAVVRCGSISRAAEELGMSQPALSQAMKSLEASAGVRLLVRTSHGVEPTEAGGSLFAAAEEAQRGIRRALDAAVRSKNELVLGTNCCACGVICAEVGRVFRSRCPGVHLTIRDLPGNDTLAEGIAANCDLIEAPFSAGYAYPSGVVFHPLLDAEIVILAPPGDDLVSLGRPLEFADFGGKTVCTYNRGVLDSNDRFLDEIRARGIDARLVLLDDREYSTFDLLVNGWLSPSLSVPASRCQPMVPLRMAHPEVMQLGLFSVGAPSAAAKLFLEEAGRMFSA